jgi:Mn-containing catalase
MQNDVKPERPDALFAAKIQELVGGQFGEMTVIVQYLRTAHSPAPAQPPEHH